MVVNEENWAVLSDAELARRGRKVTAIGLAVLLVVSIGSLLLVTSARLEPSKSGPLHIVATSKSDANATPIPVSGVDVAPRVAVPVPKKAPKPKSTFRPVTNSGPQDM